MPESAPQQVSFKPSLRTGQRVILQGLEKARELNGHRGVVVRYKEDLGRYAVRVAGKEMAIRPENLKAEGGAAEAARFAEKHKTIRGSMYNPVVAHARTPGSGDKMVHWIGQMKVGTRCVVKAESQPAAEEEPIPLWFGDRGFVNTAPVDVALLIGDCGADLAEWPKALARVLEHFPVAAGRLRRRSNRDPNSPWIIVLNNAGVPFSTATVPPCGLPSAAELQRQCFQEANGIFDISDEASQGEDQPLLRMKLIAEEGTCRGLLGISFNHALCDIHGLAMFLQWTQAELEGTGRPEKVPTFDRQAVEEVLEAAATKSSEDASGNDDNTFTQYWPLSPPALERWSFLARRLRSALRGPPDGAATAWLSVPKATLDELKQEAGAGASAFEAFVSYVGMKMHRLGGRSGRVLITKDYRSALDAAAPGRGFGSLFANAVTHELSFPLPNVAEVLEMPLAEACIAMRECMDACSLEYLAWHRKQDHHQGLPNLFTALCSNSWGRSLADVSMVEAYAVGVRSVDERAATMVFPLDAAYLQILPQPSGDWQVLLSSSLSDLTALVKELPSDRFDVPHVSEIRMHPFRVPLPPSLADQLAPAVETHHKMVRIACIGDSLTACGYPKQLQALLDKADVRTQVRNFGAVGTTALRFADKPYWDERKLETARDWRPHIVVSTLGTNDAKEGNWDQESFIKDYSDLCVEFLERVIPRPVVFLVTPPPIYEDGALEISREIVHSALPEAVRTVASTAQKTINAPLEEEAKRARKPLPAEVCAQAHVIDAFEHFGGQSLKRRGYIADDGVHPNERGTKLLSYLIFSEVLGEAKKCLQRWKDAPKVVGDGGMF